MALSWAPITSPNPEPQRAQSSDTEFTEPRPDKISAGYVSFERNEESIRTFATRKTTNPELDSSLRSE
jgi:hypothetical protein